MYGLKDGYDLAFSIGGACACSQSLRRAGMQYASFPFDWLVNYPSVTFAAEQLVNGFGGLLCREKMVCRGPNANNDKDIYQNEANGLYFLHDFPKGGDFAKEFQVIDAKYRRRANRLLKLIERGGDVLLTYVTIPDGERLPDSELVESLEVISRRFPRTRFDLLCFSQKNAGFSGVTNPAPHLYRVDFDYQSKMPGDENVSDDRMVAKVLKRVVGHVRDYRTSDERKGYGRKRREREYATYKAVNWFQYVRNKMTWKLFRHFQNQLARRGFKF